MLTKSGKVCGRPVESTAAAGYKVGPGHRTNTTVAAAAGYNTSSRRPVGTTVAAGYLSGGRTQVVVLKVQHKLLDILLECQVVIQRAQV